MEYKILNVSQIDDTIITTVEMVLSNCTQIVDINHFRPQSQEDIIANITNRILTEQSKIDSIELNNKILTEIQIGQTIIV